MSNVNYAQPIETVLENIRALTRLANLQGQDQLLIDLPSQYFTTWEAGLRLEVGDIVQVAGVKYKVLEPTIAHNHYPPYQQNLRSVYQPFQGMYNFNWVYGETILTGMTRVSEDLNDKPYVDEKGNQHYPTKTFTALADIENSTTQPSLDKANWAIVETPTE